MNDMIGPNFNNSSPKLAYFDLNLGLGVLTPLSSLSLK